MYKHFHRSRYIRNTNENRVFTILYVLHQKVFSHSSKNISIEIDILEK